MKFHHWILVFWLHFGIILMNHYVMGDQYEFALYKKLMYNYDNLVRPVPNNKEPVVVTLDIALQQIVDVDEKDQIVRVNAWLSFAWKDYRLAWNKSEWGGVTDVRFKKGYLWKPDVLLYNSVDSSFDSSYPSNMIVYSDGSITWIPPGIFQISCKINIKWFPFDEQTCFLKFGSWTYGGLKLDLQNSSVTGFDMSEYLENGEWAIQRVSVERKEKFYDCCPDEPYPTLLFYLNIRRRTLYFGFNLIIPCLLIALLTILNFTLPPDAGEKLTLSTTILLSVCFFLSILAATLPQTSEAVPLLGAFFSSCMFVVSLAVVQAVICLNLHYRTPDTHEMSHFTRSILLYWLPWFLMMKRPGYTFAWKNLPNPFSTEKDEKESESLLRNIRSQELAVDSEKGMPEMERHYSMDLEHRLAKHMRKMDSQEVSMMDMFQQAMCLMMQQIHTEIRFMTRRMRKEDEDCDAENDWKFAAMVIDRLSLFLFSIIIIVSSCGILFSAPYLVA